MKGFLPLYRRELAGYFLTPLAFVFLAVFAAAATGLAWQPGGFFRSGLADLSGFFAFHPWIYVVFLPALAMRLWAEEERTGMSEILLTLPVNIRAIVAAKFFAAWTVALCGLLLTTPLWVAVNWLGTPDNAAIAAGYGASALLAAAYLALGLVVSASTSNQVVAFVIAVCAAFVLTISGSALLGRTVADLLPLPVLQAASWISPLERFNSLQRGAIELADVTYFVSFTAVALAMAAYLIAARRGG